MIIRLGRYLSSMLLISGIALSAQHMITYENRPLGSPDRPLLLRTYLPDPGLDHSVLSHHGRGFVTAEYSPEKGEDLPETIEPLHGLPAGIAVNHGEVLSYVFDTVEGRLLYAWQGGFVDMLPYWGERNMGQRKYDYVPRLVGTLYYKAVSQHPLRINGRSVSTMGAPRFLGYDLKNNQPEFLVRHGDFVVTTRIRPSGRDHAVRVEFSVAPHAELTFRQEDPRLKILRETRSDGSLVVVIEGEPLQTFEGYIRETVSTVTAAEGEKLYRNYACAVCHSTDGSAGHGPSFGGLYGSERPLADGSMVKVDEAYLLESISNPNAKVAKGFTPGFMPTFDQFGDAEYQSLILFIKSLEKAK